MRVSHNVEQIAKKRKYYCNFKCDIGFNRFTAGSSKWSLFCEYINIVVSNYKLQIRNFPSREFYKEALEDGPDVEEQTRRSWHEYRCFGPFCFFDIHEGKESQPSGSGSWQNVDEVEFVLAMYHKLVSRYPELKSSSRLAIISPYRHQVKLLRQKFRETFGVESDKVVDINTVDGFQVILWLSWQISCIIWHLISAK